MAYGTYKMADIRSDYVRYHVGIVNCKYTLRCAILM